MVAIIPNRAEIEGKIVSIKKVRNRNDFHKLRLKLTGVTVLKGENILSDLEAGMEINMLIATEVIATKKIAKGFSISCRIRKAAGDDYFIIPDSIRIISGDPDKHVDL